METKKMTIKPVQATKALIDLGDISLEVLQFPDGSYHMFINQLNDRLGIKASDSTGKKYLQPIIDKDSKRVNQARIEGVKSNLKTLSMEAVSEAIQIYASLGNQKCIAVAIACVSEALERRADSAFGKVRSEEERNERMAVRMKGKVVRRFLTDAIKDYIENHEVSDNYKKFIFSNCSDHLNKIILGAKAKQAKEFYQVPESSLLRNHIPVEALRELELTEEMAKRLIDERDVEPLEAVKQACVLCFTKSIGL